MAETTPQTIDQDLLQQKISEMLENNGKLSESEWRKLMTYLVQDVRADLKALMAMPAEVHLLKKKNVVMWAEDHPKISIPIISAFVLLFVLHTAEIVPFVEKVATWIGKFI